MIDIGNRRMKCAQRRIDFRGNSESNLLEGNAFGNSSHIPISINGPGVTRNVIRDNTISNRWHTGSEAYPDGPRNMWEGNRFYDIGEDFEENPRHETDDRERWELPGLELGANSNIVRENVFANTGFGLYMEDWYADRTTNYNRVYSNTFDANYRSIRNMDTPQDVSFNVIKNNSITNSIEYNIWFNDMAGDNMPELNRNVLLTAIAFRQVTLSACNGNFEFQKTADTSMVPIDAPISC